VADHGGGVGGVEIARDEDRGVGIGVVVAGDELEAAPSDAAGGIDLLRGELSGLLHRKADRIAERAGDADADHARFSALARAGECGGEEQAAHARRK
jgi:hypothetical protein